MKSKKDIKKGLEICKGDGNCKRCPYYAELANCSGLLLKDAYALIEYLEAEAEAEAERG